MSSTKAHSGFTFQDTVDYYNTWDNAEPTYNNEEGTLEICGIPVMERWQTNYMQALAKVASSQGGRVLELGFGLGLSSNFIQQYGVDEHIIVEPNIEVFKKLIDFKKATNNTVIPLLAKWQEVIDLFEPQSFDGILFDTIPMSNTELHKRQFVFLEQASKLLKKNGVFTYCNVTSWGNLMSNYSCVEEMFENTQTPALKKLGFNNISFEVVTVNPGKGCKYRFNSLPAPTVKY